MAKENNAYCSICGQGYHVCNTCTETRSFMPWRTVTDTIPHYAIYMAIHGYTISKDKVKAKLELEKCDLFGLEKFNPNIKNIIDEILADDLTVYKTKKSHKKSETKNEDEEISITKNNE